MLSSHHPKLHYNSLKNALVGLKSAIASERNLRLEILIGLVAILAGTYFEFTLEKMVILWVTILLVVSVELINTSIEAMVDSVHVEHNDLAKSSKDLAAAAVLMVTVLALIVGLYLYLPPFLALFY